MAAPTRARPAPLSCSEPTEREFEFPHGALPYGGAAIQSGKFLSFFLEQLGDGGGDEAAARCRVRGLVCPLN